MGAAFRCCNIIYKAVKDNSGDIMKKTNLIHALFVVSVNAMIFLIAAKWGILISILFLVLTSFASYVLAYRKRILEMIFLKEPIEIKQTVLSLFLACFLEVFLAESFYINIY